MPKALLDTDVYSRILQGKDATVAASAEKYSQQHGRLTVSVITVMELIKGFQLAQQPHRIRPFLAQVGNEEVLELTQSAAAIAGRIWADLEKSGQPLGLADPMIAAIAIDRGFDLVTGNPAEYERIQELGHPLKIVSWDA